MSVCVPHATCIPTWLILTTVNHPTSPHRQAFGARMAEAQEKAREGGVGGEGGGGDDGAAAGGWDASVAQHTPGQVTRVHGLAHLAEFCRDVA